VKPRAGQRDTFGGGCAAAMVFVGRFQPRAKRTGSVLDFTPRQQAKQTGRSRHPASCGKHFHKRPRERWRRRAQPCTFGYEHHSRVLGSPGNQAKHFHPHLNPPPSRGRKHVLFLLRDLCVPLKYPSSGMTTPVSYLSRETTPRSTSILLSSSYSASRCLRVSALPLKSAAHAFSSSSFFHASSWTILANARSQNAV